MKLRQAYLRNDNNEVMTTWLDDRPDLKLGTFVTLRDFKPSMRWEVIHLYHHTHEAADFDFHRKWDNNNYDKHEGLKVK